MTGDEELPHTYLKMLFILYILIHATIFKTPGELIALVKAPDVVKMTRTK